MPIENYPTYYPSDYSSQDESISSDSNSDDESISSKSPSGIGQVKAPIGLILKKIPLSVLILGVSPDRFHCIEIKIALSVTKSDLPMSVFYRMQLFLVKYTLKGSCSM